MFQINIIPGRISIIKIYRCCIDTGCGSYVTFNIVPRLEEVGYIHYPAKKVKLRVCDEQEKK